MAAPKPKARADLRIYAFDEELLLYDPVTRFVHYMNPLAALVFQLCDGTSTVKETAFELSEALGLQVEQLEPEVRAIVRQQRRQNLFERRRRKKDEPEAEDDRVADGRERVRMNVPRST